MGCIMGHSGRTCVSLVDNDGNGLWMVDVLRVASLSESGSSLEAGDTPFFRVWRDGLVTRHFFSLLRSWVSLEMLVTS